jgi:hypothetical protein
VTGGANGGLTDPDTGRPVASAPSRSRLAAVRVAALQAVALLAAYAVVAAAAGWLWHELWSPELGVVVQHQWYATGDALRDDFSGTGLYVLVALGGGVVLGLAGAYVGGARPLVTVVAAAAGSVLAAYVMIKVGESLGPQDPHRLAATAKDGTNLPSALRVTGFSPLLAFPFGTLVALAVVFTLFPGKSRDRGFAREPRG